MSPVTTFRLGTPCFVDVESPDRAATAAFYTSLFGWTLEDHEEEGYGLFFLDGRLAAGLGTLSSGEEPPGWTTYVRVSSLADTLETAKGAGAHLLRPPTRLLDAADTAVVSDPGGAAIALWEPEGREGSELVNELGGFCWTELQTAATRDSKAYYRELFGWGERTSDFGGVAYTEWLRAEDSVAGMMAMPPDLGEAIPAFWLVYFGVADCDGSVARAVELGASVLVPPFNSPAGRFAVVQDGLGASFAVIALTGL